MSRLTLAVCCTLALFAASNLLASAGLLLHWRLRRARWIDRSASQLLFLRCLPAALSAALSLWIVLPSFLTHEPRDRVEPVGLPLALAAACGLLILLHALGRGLRALVRTRRTVRDWMRSATPVELAHWPGAAWLVATDAAGVSFVGFLRWKLLLSRGVVAACSECELAGIVAHERAHASRRDNWKKLLVACLPDAVAPTPAAWAIECLREARAEEEADGVARGDDPLAGAELAGALLKLARRTDALGLGVATSFHACGPIERRVRLLLGGGPASRARRAAWGGLALGTLATALVCAAFPALSSRVHLAVELMVRLLGP